MAGQHNICGPDFEDWLLFDPSNTHVDPQQWLGYLDSSTDVFLSYLPSLPNSDFDFSEPSQASGISLPKPAKNHDQGRSTNELVPKFPHDGNSGSSTKHASSIAFPPNDPSQSLLAASAPERYAFMSSDVMAPTFLQPSSSSKTPSILSASLASLRSPQTAPLPEISSIDHTSSRCPKSNEFIQYTVDRTTNKMKKFDLNANSRKGRKGKLTDGQRRDACRMRKIGACSNCRARRGKCDDGLYCRACIHHFKDDLIYQPCRGKLLDSLADVLLDGRLPWHPFARSLKDFLGPGKYKRSIEEFPIPINFGFGPPLDMQARMIEVADPSLLRHKHVISAFPPMKDGPVNSGTETHVVLPVVLADSDPETMRSTLDQHFNQLIDRYFQDFPLYDSELMLLTSIWVVYKQLEEGAHRDLIRKTLKLLALVHIGDVISVDPSFHLLEPCLYHLAAYHENPGNPFGTATPCFIRAQLGGVIEMLAKSMLKDILATLESLSLSARCSDWYVVLSVNLLLVMAMETVQYHSRRAGFHALQDFPPCPSEPQVIGAQDLVPSASGSDTCMAVESNGVDHLLGFYAACFGNCHSRLDIPTKAPKPTSMSRLTSLGSAISSISASSATKRGGMQRSTSRSSRQQDIADEFIKGLRAVIERKRSYLEACRQRNFQSADSQGRDPIWLFDRLVARLLLGGT